MIKTILAPATGGAADAVVHRTALAVARACAAHLDVLHVRIDAAGLAVTMASEGGGATMVSDLIDRLEAESDKREANALAAFREFCRAEGLALAEGAAAPPPPSAAWHREAGSEAGWFGAYGRAADLIVIARPGEGDGIMSDTLERTLLDSGRPLLIPAATPLSALPQRVAIAWKETPQAARAVAAVLPLLSPTTAVSVLTVEEERAETAAEEEARLLAYLARHGCAATARRLAPSAAGAAEVLLAAAGADNAELLVMGGYGHSRLREWVFGGVTERVLREAPIAVLMMH
jgi:nucleotide-binding universal stress UspA family protein